MASYPTNVSSLLPNPSETTWREFCPRGEVKMKVAAVAIAIILVAAWAQTPAGSKKVGTVKTGSGKIDILSVYTRASNSTSMNKSLSGNNFAPRVLDGQKVKGVWQFPQIVSIGRRFNSNDDFILACTGTLIDFDVVMSAAHCFDPTFVLPSDEYLVCAGSLDWENGGKWEKCSFVKNIYIPGEYYVQYYFKTWNAYDMAVLKLEKSVKGPRIRRAKISFDKPRHATPALVAGFGFFDFSNAGQMYYSDHVIHLNDGRCEYLNEFEDMPNDARFICAIDPAGSVTCFGDSGGPLFVKRGNAKNHVQVGVLSFGPEDCQASPESVWTSFYGPGMKRIIRYMVKTVAGGRFIKILL